MNELNKIVDQLSKLTLLEAAQLAKLLEDKWGILPSLEGNKGSTTSTDKKNVQQVFKVVITSVGDKKIAVIKAIKQLTNLSLKESKGLIDSIPATLKENLPKQEAEKYKTTLIAAGAVVELK